MPNFFQHAAAIVETDKVGNGTRVWAFTHILPGATLGADCNVCDHVFIENDVIIGDRVTIKCGVQIWDGLRIEDDVFIGPNATFTNDLFPRSKVYPEKFTQTVVRQGASIGANATILAGVTIGRNAMVGAGAVITKDVPPHAVVVGNPGQIKGYVNVAKATDAMATSTLARQFGPLGVGQVELRELPIITDLRGSLSVGEYGKHLPFEPQRYFLVFDVKSREVRGEHAHKCLEQFLVCVRGSCSVMVDDGQQRAEVQLDSPGVGLYIPPLVWGVQYKYTADAVLLVLASAPYDADDYIRDYDEFLETVEHR